jgi:hypothetical protein
MLHSEPAVEVKNWLYVSRGICDPRNINLNTFRGLSKDGCLVQGKDTLDN